MHGGGGKDGPDAVNGATEGGTQVEVAHHRGEAIDVEADSRRQDGKKLQANAKAGRDGESDGTPALTSQGNIGKDDTAEGFEDAELSRARVVRRYEQ
jgi:hypothetical protein